MSFVLECDGCMIDDDEVLDCSIQNGDVLMVLMENQSWTASSSCPVSPVNLLVLSKQLSIIKTCRFNM